MKSRRMAELVLLVAACVLPPALEAQEHPLVADHPGAWAEADLRAGNLPPATRAAALAVVKQIEDILRKMPALTPAAGFEVIPHTIFTLDNVDRSDNPHLPKLVTIEMTLNIAPYERSSGGVTANERDTAGSVTVLVNDLSHTGSAPMGGAWSDDQGNFIQDPDDPVDTRHGSPVYQDGNGDQWLLMRRHAVPVLAPVTRERYLLCVMKQSEDALKKAQDRRARIPASVPANIVAEVDEAIAHEKTHLADLQQQYNGMSAADRRLPVDEGKPSFFFNPALIDPSVPPATPQVISVRLLSNDTIAPGLGEKLDQQLDWAALAKLLR
jgi:hypothetical protein